MKKAKKAIVVEDLISTGKSSLQVVDVLRSADVEVIGMVSIFNYGFDAARDAFRNAKVETESLTSYESLVNLAIEKNIVSAEAEELLKSWRTSPSTWGS